MTVLELQIGNYELRMDGAIAGGEERFWIYELR